MTANTFSANPRMSGNDKLEELRAELDQVDERLLDYLSKRFEICVRIAEHKREHAVPVMQPGRMRIVHERAKNYAAAHGINRTFIRQLYELIISETCRVENIVIDSNGAA